jgi:LysM repeat protein
VAAVPALFGVAAVAAVASTSGHGGPSAAARVATAQTSARADAARPNAVTPTAAQASKAAEATEAVQAVPAVPDSTAAPAATTHAALPATYTVASGDTLSALAMHFYQSPNYWPVLYWANHGHIRYANDIAVGQVLTVPVKPAKIPAAPTTLSAAPAPSTATASASGSAQSTPTWSSARSSAASSTVSASGSGSFQSCVIARESGGNSQVMNGSGHYGLYQFSASTWAAYGGNPADFGSASVAEQNQVFNNAIAAGGASNWSAYDGC